jgi:hypothetical protein
MIATLKSISNLAQARLKAIRVGFVVLAATSLLGCDAECERPLTTNQEAYEAFKQVVLTKHVAEFTRLGGHASLLDEAVEDKTGMCPVPRRRYTFQRMWMDTNSPEGFPVAVNFHADIPGSCQGCWDRLSASNYIGRCGASFKFQIQVINTRSNPQTACPPRGPD